MDVTVDSNRYQLYEKQQQQQQKSINFKLTPITM